MSYILDALNKSEQERQHQRLPNLKTSHVPIVNHSGHRSLMIVLIALLAILLITGTVFAFWYLNLTPRTQPAPITAKTGVAPVAGNILGHAADKPMVDYIPGLPVNQNSAAKNDFPAAESSTNEFQVLIEPGLPLPVTQPGEEIIVPQTITANVQSSAPNSFPVPDIVDLPLSIQQQIPTLIFSTHIYASEPAWRMVGINGKSRRQGDTITDSLRLLEITEDGVVLEYNHHKFRMSVVRNWSGR